MFRQMRRVNNQMADDKAKALLLNCQEGVLGTISVDNGYPYTVVINYVVYHDKIYFHTSTMGHKVENIMNDSRVSFTVFNNVKVIEETFTTKYQSVTLFGKAKVIESTREILYEFIKKYSPSFLTEGKKYVDKEFQSPSIIEIDIEYITGKERL